ncbi:MAG: rubrerythrin family protein [Thermoprotei archaeon]|nr:MAG: rubrerythrin family protein [Thermoprotei archaeon]
MSETLMNLVKAFIGESQARNRYTFYAKRAKEEGFMQVAEVFELIADNEKEHAETLFQLIQGLKKGVNELVVEAVAPLGYGSTVENLRSAIQGEGFEAEEMYPRFAEVAEHEGLVEVAQRLKAIAVAESHHRERFKRLLDVIEHGWAWRRDREVHWACMECGYVHYGREPPEKCPSCGHPRGYFKVKSEEC